MSFWGLQKATKSITASYDWRLWQFHELTLPLPNPSISFPQTLLKELWSNKHFMWMIMSSTIRLCSQGNCPHSHLSVYSSWLLIFLIIRVSRTSISIRKKKVNLSGEGIWLDKPLIKVWLIIVFAHDSKFAISSSKPGKGLSVILQTLSAHHLDSVTSILNHTSEVTFSRVHDVKRVSFGASSQTPQNSSARRMLQ